MKRLNIIRRASSLLLLAAMAASAEEFDGWHPVAWSRERWGTNDLVFTGTVWCTTHVLPFTNFVGTNVVISNQTVRSNFRWLQTTSPVISTWNVLSFSNGQQRSYLMTDTVTPASVTLALQPRDVIVGDVFHAIRERMQAITNAATVQAVMSTFPPIFRHDGQPSLRESLIWTKEWIDTYHSNFVRADLLGTNANYVNWFKAAPTNSPPMFENRNMATQAPTNLPMNYLDETPNRYLRCLDPGRTRIMTSRVTYAGTATTNQLTVVNSCDQTVTITNTWTNGAFVDVVCTNDLWAAAGSEWSNATSETWGWCAVTGILNRLIHTPSPFCGNDASIASYITEATAYYSYDMGPACSTLTGAIATVGLVWDAETDLGCSGDTTTPSFAWAEDNGCGLVSRLGKQFDVYPYTFDCPPSSTNINATGAAINRGAYLRHSVGSASTGITHRADLYVSCTTNAPSGQVDAPTLVCNYLFEYDDYGLGLTTNLSVFGSVTSTGPTDDYILFGDDPDVKLPIPTTPTNTTPGVGDYVIRGHADPVLFWVVDWSVSGGFSYK